MLAFAIGFTAYASVMAYALGHHLCGKRAGLMLALSITVALALWVKSSGWLLGVALFALVFMVFSAGAARIAARIWPASRPA